MTEQFTRYTTLIRITILMLPVIAASLLIGDFVRSNNVALAGLAAVLSVIVIGAACFFLRHRVFKVQGIAAVAFTVVILVMLTASFNTPLRKLRRELRGEWRSIPRADELDDVLTLRFVSDENIEIGFYDLHQCTYAISEENTLTIIENQRTSTMKIIHLQNDSLQLATGEDTIRFFRLH